VHASRVALRRARTHVLCLGAREHLLEREKRVTAADGVLLQEADVVVRRDDDRDDILIGSAAAWDAAGSGGRRRSRGGGDRRDSRGAASALDDARLAALPAGVGVRHVGGLRALVRLRVAVHSDYFCRSRHHHDDAEDSDRGYPYVTPDDGGTWEPLLDSSFVPA